MEEIFGLIEITKSEKYKELCTLINGKDIYTLEIEEIDKIKENYLSLMGVWYYFNQHGKHFSWNIGRFLIKDGFKLNTEIRNTLENKSPNEIDNIDEFLTFFKKLRDIFIIPEELYEKWNFVNKFDKINDYTNILENEKKTIFQECANEWCEKNNITGFDTNLTDIIFRNINQKKSPEKVFLWKTGIDVNDKIASNSDPDDIFSLKEYTSDIIVFSEEYIVLLMQYKRMKYSLVWYNFKSKKSGKYLFRTEAWEFSKTYFRDFNNKKEIFLSTNYSTNYFEWNKIHMLKAQEEDGALIFNNDFCCTL